MNLETKKIVNKNGQVVEAAVLDFNLVESVHDTLGRDVYYTEEQVQAAIEEQERWKKIWDAEDNMALYSSNNCGESDFDIYKEMHNRSQATRQANQAAREAEQQNDWSIVEDYILINALSDDSDMDF